MVKDAPGVTRTPGTGIRNQNELYFNNQGRALSIGLLPFSVKDLTHI